MLRRYGLPLFDQRPRRTPGRTDGRFFDRRDHLGAQVPDFLNMVHRQFNPIRVLCQPKGGTQNRKLALRYDDIAFTGIVKPVDHHICQTAADGCHNTGSWLQRQLDAGQIAYFTGPGTGRVYEQIPLLIIFAPLSMIENADSRHRRVGFMEADSLREIVNPGAVGFGGGIKMQGKPPGIHGGIRHTNGRPQIRMQGRLNGQCLIRGQILGRNTAFFAFFQKQLPVIHVGII